MRNKKTKRNDKKTTANEKENKKNKKRMSRGLNSDCLRTV